MLLNPPRWSSSSTQVMATTAGMISQGVMKMARKNARSGPRMRDMSNSARPPPTIW